MAEHTHHEQSYTYWLILIPSIILLSLGLITLHSAGQSETPILRGTFQKQLISVFIALGAGVVSFLTPLSWLRQRAPLILVLGLIGLIVVLIPSFGLRINGAQRWISLGPMRLQVSELAKVSLSIGLCAYCARHQSQMKGFWKGFVIPGALIGAFFSLIIVEPDFGTAILCALVGGLVLFIAGTRLRYLLCSGLFLTLLVSVALIHDPVRFRRISSFLDIQGNKNDSAYQLWQGIVGFGVGSWNGVGIGKGRQQMSFLPEAHTDFILSILGEEMGLIMTLMVVICFSAIFFLTLSQLSKAPNAFECLLVLTSVLFISFQALINIAVVTGCIPTKGIPLPFISYGGSNLIAISIFIGLILNGLHTWNQPIFIEASRT